MFHMSLQLKLRGTNSRAMTMHKTVILPEVPIPGDTIHASGANFRVVSREWFDQQERPIVTLTDVSIPTTVAFEDAVREFTEKGGWNVGKVEE